MRAQTSGDVATAIEERTAIEVDTIMALPRERRYEAFLTYALEREQIVDVVYSEDAIAAVIDALDVDDDVREVVRRAILWLQRDEALHAQYLRGRLLRSRAPRAWAPIFATQAVGAIGGWCSAVSPSSHDDAFGLRRAAARSVLWAGGVTGRIPTELAAALRLSGFGAFCATNRVLEQSAVTAYRRVLEIVEGEEHALFSRILDDEIRHANVFGLFLELFDDNQLKPGVGLGDLVSGLDAVSPWLVPARFRTAEPTNGAPTSGNDEDTVFAATGETVADAIASALGESGVDITSNLAGKRVAIRVNFMLAYHRDDTSNHVSPAVVAEVARILRSGGAADVAVIEAPNVYDRYAGGRSVAEVARYAGFDEVDYRLVDATDDMVDVVFERGLATTRATRAWVDADVRIVIAKLAGAPSEIVQGILATVAGLSGRVEDEQFYTHRLVDHRTAALMVLDAAPIDVAIVDAWGDVADGPLGVLGCNRPSEQHRIYAGRDAVGVDATVIADLGIDPAGSEILRRADQWFGSHDLSSYRPSTLGQLEDFRAPQGNWWFRLINATAVHVYMNFSGNGRLFVPRFDDAAFPPIDEPGIVVRSVRRAAQRAFGLHPPARQPTSSTSLSNGSSRSSSES